MKLYNFNGYEQNFKTYGGTAGVKIGITIKGVDYMLKYPGKLKDAHMKNVEISYSNSPVCEHLGCEIFKSIGIDTQKTYLGVRNDKIVVACRDFLKPGEIFVPFKDIKATFEPAFTDPQGDITNGTGTNLDEIIRTMNEHPLLRQFPDIKKRFWDMFIVDSLIGNPDRNNENWGLIRSTENSFRIAPVFDCGNCFNGKLSERQMREFLSGNMQEISLMRPCIYERAPGKRINAHQYISSHINKDCDKAVNRIVPRIDLNEISGIINDTPGIGDVEKEFYERLIQIRYEENLVPALQYLRKRELEFDMEER